MNSTVNNRGTVLMLVVVSAFIMSIVGLGSINLMGMQEIQARAELDIQRAHATADAGLEMAKVWLASACVHRDDGLTLFPENVSGDRNPILIAHSSLGGQGTFVTKIVPAENPDIDPASYPDSLRGEYSILSDAYVSSQTIPTTLAKAYRVHIFKGDGSFVDNAPALPGKQGSATATLLPNNKILLAGGDNGNVVGCDALGTSTIGTSYIYDPQGNGGAGSVTTTSSLIVKREKHIAVLLTTGPASGCVLIAGGARYDPVKDYTYSTADAVLYNPADGVYYDTWNGVSVGDMTTDRSCHTAVVLPTTGEVLIMGGHRNECDEIWRTAETFDPQTLQFTATGDMGSRRHCFPASILPDGRVLVTGGDPGTAAGITSAEIYDPANRSFSNTGSMKVARRDHIAVTLPNGDVLVAGGWKNSSTALSSAEIYHNGVFNYTKDIAGNTTSMKQVRADIYAFMLPNKKVLIAGGINSSCIMTNTAELYDPATGTFEYTDSMKEARRCENNANVQLKNGDVVIAGGWGNSEKSLSSIEKYVIPLEAQQVINSYFEGPCERNTN